MYEAKKTSKICSFWTNWPVIQLINYRPECTEVVYMYVAMVTYLYTHVSLYTWVQVMSYTSHVGLPLSCYSLQNFSKWTGLQKSPNIVSQYQLTMINVIFYILIGFI